MGSTETKYEKTREGSKKKLGTTANLNYKISNGNSSHRYCTNLSEQIDAALSCIKVSKLEAFKLECRLQSEYFERWKEDCIVHEYCGYSMNQLNSLLRDISRSVDVPGSNVYNKLRGITFAEEMQEKIYSFCFGDELQSGVIHFATIVLCKRNATLHAASSLYRLNFKLGRTLVKKTTDHFFLGINYSTDECSWYEQTGLDFITKDAFLNYCKVKALNKFRSEGLVSHINDQTALPS